MRIKGIYAIRPVIIQLLILSLFLLAGTIPPSIISTSLLLTAHGLQADITQDASSMRLTQFILIIYTFLLPSIAMAWICSNNPCHYLPVKKITDDRIWILTLVCVFLPSPVINSLGLLNKQIELPTFMVPIEEWMWAQEIPTEQLAMVLLSSDSVWMILASLAVIAVMARITEEFLFRGALQRVIGKWTSDLHTVIWVAAILFSAFHLQFYGFLPRMVLGAYLGYLLYWSKSIWIPMFVRFVNSVFTVIGMSDSRLKDNELIAGDIPAEHLLDFCLIAVLSFLLFTLVNRQLKRLL